MSLDLRTVLCEVVLGTLSSWHFLAKVSARFSSLLLCCSVDMVLVLFHHFFFFTRVCPSVCYGTYFSLVSQPYCISSGLLQTWQICLGWRYLLHHKSWLWHDCKFVQGCWFGRHLTVLQKIGVLSGPSLYVYHSANRVYPYRWAQLT